MIRLDAAPSHLWHLGSNFCTICGRSRKHVVETGYICPGDQDGKLLGISHIVRGRRLAAVVDKVVDLATRGPLEPSKPPC